MKPTRSSVMARRARHQSAMADRYRPREGKSPAVDPALLAAAIAAGRLTKLPEKPRRRP